MAQTVIQGTEILNGGGIVNVLPAPGVGKTIHLSKVFVCVPLYESGVLIGLSNGMLQFFQVRGDSEFYSLDFNTEIKNDGYNLGENNPLQLEVVSVFRIPSMRDNRILVCAIGYIEG